MTRWYDELNHIMHVTGPIEIPSNLKREAYHFCKLLALNTDKKIELPSIDMIEGELILIWNFKSGASVAFRFSDLGISYKRYDDDKLSYAKAKWRHLNTLHAHFNAVNLLQ